PDKKIAAAAHLNIGLAYLRVPSSRAKTEQHYRDALALYETAGDQLGQATTLYRLIGVDRREGIDLAKRALPLFAAALPALQASGDQKELANAYYAMGSMLYRQKKDYPAALDSFKKALEIRRTLPDQAALISLTQNQIRMVQQK